MAATAPRPGGCQLFPSDSVYHADVSALPVHPRSSDWIAASGGSNRRLHPDFGPNDQPGAAPYGIPFTTASASAPRVGVAFEYGGESDPGPYPLNDQTPIEGGSDRHALVVTEQECKLFETFATEKVDGSWRAGSGAIFDLRSYAMRPDTWTSADAAGLAILPLLIRRAEIVAGEIDHPIRMTVQRSSRSYLWPARHQAGATNNPADPPMGAWFRLKADVDIGAFSSETQVILRAMKKHGLVVADNGSNWYFGGASEPGWSSVVLDQLKSLRAGQFEAVDTAALVDDPNTIKVRGAPAPIVLPSIPLAPDPLLFAEGTTRAGFQEYLTLLNPSAQPTRVAIDQLFDASPPLTVEHDVPAHTRVTVDINATAGPGRDASLRVRPLTAQGVVAERPLYFSGIPIGTLGSVAGGHVGSPLLAKSDWYFAEGTTRAGFQEYLTIANPANAASAGAANTAATVRVSFAGSPAVSRVTVPPGERRTIDVNAVVGPGVDAAAHVRVESGPEVIVERPMYFAAGLGFTSQVVDGSVSPGAGGTNTLLFFAEGTTRAGFQEYITVYSPPGFLAPVRFRVTFAGSGAAPLASPMTLEIKPGERATIDVNQAVGGGRDVAARIDTLQGAGVVAERVVYFAAPLVAGATVDGGHVNVGAAGSATRWLFAEGTTRAGFQQYLTLLNPGPVDTDVRLTYLRSGGEPIQRTLSVGAGTRATVDVNTDTGGPVDVSTVVEAVHTPILAERPIYFRTPDGGHIR